MCGHSKVHSMGPLLDCHQLHGHAILCLRTIQCSLRRHSCCCLLQHYQLPAATASVSAKVGRHSHAVLTLILLAPNWTYRTQTKGLHTSRNASTSSCGVTFDQSIGPAVDPALLRFPLHTAHCCAPAVALPSFLSSTAQALQAPQRALRAAAADDEAAATLVWLPSRTTQLCKGFC